jgi:sec-independent protein translocase protein TatA
MLGFGMPGMSEWLVILVIVLIFFGAGKLPEVFAQAGKGIKAFKDASEGKPVDGEDDDEEEPRPRRRKRRKQIARDPDELDDDEEEADVAEPVAARTVEKKGER